MTAEGLLASSGKHLTMRQSTATGMAYVMPNNPTGC